MRGVHVWKFDDPNGVKVLGNMIKNDLRSSEIEWGRSNGI
jgi:hypothetical protein